MSFDFKPRERSAFDETSGISVLRPRMLPASLPGRTDAIEYQYSFRRDGQSIGAMGFFGTEEKIEKGARREWVYTLDLGPDAVLEDVLRFKNTIGNTERNAEFLRGFAQGLVNALVGQVAGEDDLRYVASTHAGALARFGIPIPDGSRSLPEGRIILADVLVPGHMV